MHRDQTRTEWKAFEMPRGEYWGQRDDQSADPAVTDLTERVHAAITASSVPIVVIDDDTSVHLWNPAAEHVFGCSKEEVSGGTIPIVPFEKHDASTRPRQTAAASDTLAGVETYSGMHDGASAAACARAIHAVVLMHENGTSRQRVETAHQDAILALTSWGDMGAAVADELSSGRLLRTITEACTRIAGAQFGAASYKVADDGRGYYLLHALSGTPRHALGTRAIPHKPIAFPPTSVEETSVRSGEITTELWFDKSMPNRGKSPQRRPVTSYLAVPMIGRSGEVFGGLFLGHPDAGVFTEDAKQVVAALAAHAAIAIDNARLYEAERRAHHAASTASRAKDEFLAVLGHELRNPLSTVRNCIETAHLDPALRDRALELARHGAEQLTRLVDDLLDVARITNGKTALRREAVPLASIVERAIEDARQLIEERGHALTVSLVESNLRVDGDPLRLEQVIANLLSNAAKYMNPGGQITVAVMPEETEAVVRVRDTGIGIAPEVLPRVFELFAQAEQSRDHARGGLGIGLALVKRLVELHGGRVEAHSDGCGRGAEFVVRLPAVAPVGAGAIPRSPAELDDLPRARVLMVEDNADTAEMITMLLERLGHRVRAVGDGPSALRAAIANPPDVMLVDIGLPGMDGYEVAQKVRQLEGLQHVNLVALTGYTREEDQQRALAAGFDYHLAKPVDVHELRGLVERFAAASRQTKSPPR